MKRFRKNRRRGAVSLAELLVVASTCTVVLTMSAQLIQRTMKSQSRAATVLGVERNALRLAQQFRHDVHRAAEAKIDTIGFEDGVFLQLQLSGDTSVEYRRRDGAIERVLSRADESTAREEFAFDPAIELSLREEESPQRLVLSLAAGPRRGATTTTEPTWSRHSVPVSLLVEARLGRWEERR